MFGGPWGGGLGGIKGVGHSVRSWAVIAISRPKTLSEKRVAATAIAASPSSSAAHGERSPCPEPTRRGRYALAEPYRTCVDGLWATQTWGRCPLSEQRRGDSTLVSSRPCSFK